MKMNKNRNLINMNKNSIIGLGPNSKLVREYKQSLISLNTEQWEASIGLMLGDASLQTQNNGKNYRLKFVRLRSQHGVIKLKLI